MEERLGMYDAELAVQLLQIRRRIEDICRDECGFQLVFVQEQVVAELDEGASEIRSVYVFRWGAVDDQAADLLAEAAAQIEQLLACFDAGKNFIVNEGAVDGRVEEAKAADAWVRVLNSKTPDEKVCSSISRDVRRAAVCLVWGEGNGRF